jgi:hypothetical protein
VATQGSWKWISQQVGKYLWRAGINPVQEQAEGPPLQDHFAMLHAYYNTQQLYSRIRRGLGGSESQEQFYNIENLRSPAFEATEFHVGHWWPGTLPEALPINESDSALNKKGRDAIQEVWKASNWNSKKQIFARTTTWAGNGFIRIQQRESDGMPYKTVLQPQYVREFKVDERGILTYLRYAYPVSRGKGRDKKKRWVTEIFDLEREGIIKYEDWRAVDDERDTESSPKIVTLKSMKIDFLPVVWAPFMEESEGMGLGVFEPHLDKIDNLNRAATRLDDMLFRYDRAYWFLESAGLTADNVEMPPPEVVGSWATMGTNLSEDEKIERYGAGPQRHPDGTLTLGDDVFMKTPMGWTTKQAVPAIDYQGAINIIDGHMDVLKRDMPELRYNDAIESQARDSAKVLDLQLAGAVDRAHEGRANGEAAMIRAAQIAITIGQRSGRRSPKVRGIFESLGKYEEGDLDFVFKKRPVIIPTPSDDAAEQSAQAQALNEKINVLRAAGLDTKVILPDVAKLIGVDESKLEEDESLDPENLEGQGPGETGSVLQGILKNTQKPQAQSQARRPTAEARANGAQGGATSGSNNRRS